MLLSRAVRAASRPVAAVLVLALAGTWVIVSIVTGFPATLTLAMVFVIQHTQARHQRATQRKLDEILFTMPGTDNTLVTLEHASDDELHAIGHQHRSARQAVLAESAGQSRGTMPRAQIKDEKTYRAL